MSGVNEKLFHESDKSATLFTGVFERRRKSGVIGSGGIIWPFVHIQ